MNDEIKIANRQVDRLKRIVFLQNLLIAKLREKAGFYETDEIEVAILNLSDMEGECTQSTA